jgi:transposase
LLQIQDCKPLIRKGFSIQNRKSKIQNWYKQLQIPDNILLVFQPAHAPELNPIERLWQHLKSKLAWNLYDSLDQLREALAQQLQQLPSQTVASLTGWDYILDALSVAGIS